jgi:hypothetical protein
MKKFRITDIFCGLVATGCLVLIGLGCDGEVKALLGVIVGFYVRDRVMRDGTSN